MSVFSAGRGALIAIFTLILAVLILPSGADAQGADEYLQENPFLGVDRDENRRIGADDSTTGSTYIRTAAQLSLEPSSASWTGTTDWKILTLRNNGQMATSALNISTSNGFQTSHSCTSLQEDGVCEIQVRPTSTSTVSGSLTVTAQFGGTVTAALSATSPSPARLTITPANHTWQGPAGSHDWQAFKVTNVGGSTAPNNVQAGVAANSWLYFDFTESYRGDMGSNWSQLKPGESYTISVRPKADQKNGMTYSALVGVQIPGQSWVYGRFSAINVNQVVRACSNLPANACLLDMGFFPGFTGFAPGTPGDCSQSSYFATPVSDRWSCQHPSSSNYNPAIPNGICASNSWTPIGGYATSLCPQPIINGGVHQCPRFYRCN